MANRWYRRLTAPLTSRLPKGVSHLGAGLITGVADDDPSGIATYAQAGARYGLDMLWTMPLAYPLMAAIQSVSARIGRVTGQGLAANIRASFPPIVLKAVLVLLIIANTLNIGADLAAMGEVGEDLAGVNRLAATIGFGLLTLGLQVTVPYHRYVHVLKWLTLSLLAYVAVLFTIHVPWGEVVARTVHPRLPWTREAATMVVGIFGTTISPYLFFWQASEEVEDMKDRPSLLADPASAPAELHRIEWDTWSGMFYSDLTAYVIILATALTLNRAGITDITTAAEAAGALRPLAGTFAFLLFALGILGVGLIGVPVLAGSGAYALAEAMGWRTGLERTVAEAPGFYAVIGLSIAAGLALQALSISPMTALVWSAVLNGIVAVPLMAVILIMARRRAVMGAFVVPRILIWLGWIGTAVMALAAGLMLVG